MKPKSRVGGTRPTESNPRVDDRQTSYQEHSTLGRANSNMGLRTFSHHDYSDDGSERQSVQSLFAKKQDILARVMSPNAFKKHLLREEAVHLKDKLLGEQVYTKEHIATMRKDIQREYCGAIEQREELIDQYKYRCEQLQHEHNLMQSQLAKANSKIRVMSMRDAQSAVEIRNYVLIAQQLRKQLESKRQQNDYLGSLVRNLKDRENQSGEQRQLEQNAFSEAMDQMHEQVQKYQEALTSMQRDLVGKSMYIDQLEQTLHKMQMIGEEQEYRTLQHVSSQGSFHKAVQQDAPFFGTRGQLEDDLVRANALLKKKDESVVILEERLTETRARLEQVLNELQRLEKCREQRDQMVVRNEFLEGEIIRQMELVNQASLSQPQPDNQLKDQLDIMKSMMDMVRQQNDILLEKIDQMRSQLDEKSEQLAKQKAAVEALRLELNSLVEKEQKRSNISSESTILQTSIQTQESNTNAKILELEEHLIEKEREINELHKYASRLEDAIEEIKQATEDKAALKSDEEHNPELLNHKAHSSDTNCSDKLPAEPACPQPNSSLN